MRRLVETRSAADFAFGFNPPYELTTRWRSNNATAFRLTASQKYLRSSTIPLPEFQCRLMGRNSEALRRNLRRGRWATLRESTLRALASIRRASPTLAELKPPEFSGRIEAQHILWSMQSLGAVMARRILLWALILFLLAPIAGYGQVSKEQGPAHTVEENGGPTVAQDSGQTSSRGREANADGDEYWPPLYGYRLKVTDTLLTAFTFLLFLATLALWFATRGLVKSADRNAGLQLRAYVSVQSCRVEDYVVGQPVSIVVVVRNSGQTPSHVTTIVAALKYRPKSDQQPLTLKPSGTNSSSSLASGAIETIKLISSAPLTREQTMAIANGEARIIVHGEMRYVTVFGDPAATHFKFYYDDACIRRGDKVLHVASDGNSAT